MKRNGLSLVLRIFIGIIIPVLIGAVSIAVIKKVKVNNTKKSITESIAYIKQNFSCLDSTMTRNIIPEVVEIIDSARFAATEACGCLERMNEVSEYRKFKKRDPVLENSDYRSYADKMPIFAAGVLMGMDLDCDSEYQNAISQVLMQYVRLGKYNTDTTLIPWPLISLSNYLEQKKVRDERSSQSLSKCYEILLNGAKNGETVVPIRKAIRIRKKRDNDIEILSFDDSVLDFIIRYDRILMDYCHQQGGARTDSERLNQ